MFTKMRTLLLLTLSHTISPLPSPNTEVETGAMEAKNQSKANPAISNPNKVCIELNLTTILTTFAIFIPIYYCVCYCLANVIVYCCEKAEVKSFQKKPFPAQNQDKPEITKMYTFKQDVPGQENGIILHTERPAVI